MSSNRNSDLQMLAEDLEKQQLGDLESDKNSLEKKLETGRDGINVQHFTLVLSNDNEGDDSKCGRYETDDEYYPDGGWQAWLVVFGAFMGIFPIWGMFNSLGAIEGYISKHQLAGVKPTAVSWIFSIHLTVCSACCVFSGAYFDRNGAREAVIVGGALYVLGIFFMSMGTEVWHFIASFSIMCGCAAGILTTPLISSVATWFNERRAAATSLATVGSSIGGIIIPITLRKLYVQVGYVWAIRILALICLFCMTLASIFTRERVKPKCTPFNSYKEAYRYYLSNSFNWRYFLDQRFLWCTISFSLAENSICMTATYISSYMVARGYSESMSYTLLTVINAGGIFGRYIPGYLADTYFGRFNVVIFTSIFAAIVNLCMWLPFGNHSTVMWVYAVIYGFLIGSVFSLTPVCIGQICKTSDFGKKYSTAYLLTAAMTLPIIPIGGAIIGEGTIQNYNNFIIFTSMLMLAGGLCYILSRTLCVGFRISKF
ncbi:Mch4p Ecym_2054 [Eremothecium cymbalariae DBVPG|uniref:Major facilitator superfamily (MFS) profile domain-containing protein n=1 Tax=Eremothecium cymbalariae (strain CBS 270.75 / DBVPG 7215 / KCTC 17166 / NRRL Y-17582) TaxID=931890 RepID=G8JP11_ERECY|nr:Hypothetical protein Ecym_2054 [Eremothecium cymbalariae DBVPG\